MQKQEQNSSRKKVLRFLTVFSFFFLFLIPNVLSGGYLDFLTRGLANTLYCQLIGCTMAGNINMNNFSIFNAQWINATYTNISINYTQVTNPIWVNESGDVMTGNLILENLTGDVFHGNLTCTNITGATSNLCTLVDTTNTTTEIRIAINGSDLNLNTLGIGTTSPSQRFEVAGYINVTGTGTSNSTFSGDVRIIGTLSGSSPLKIGGGLNITSGVVIIPASNFSVNNNTLFVNTDTRRVGVRTSTPEESFVVNGTAFFDGNVGIGERSPNYKLTVVGAVNITQGINITGIIQFRDLLNCDTINTTGDGTLVCGTDGGGTATDVYVNETGDTMSGVFNLTGNFTLDGSTKIYFENDDVIICLGC